jgi:hypothetical protein
MRAGLLLLALLGLVAAGVWWLVQRGGADTGEEPRTVPGGAGGAAGYRVLPADPSWGAIEGTVRLGRNIGVPVLRRKPGCENDVSWTERASDILAYQPETGMLQDCIVYIRKIEAGKDWPEPLRSEPRTLTMTLRDGMLVPHVSWVRTGTGLSLVSAMPRSESNPQGNFARLTSGAPPVVAFNLMLSPLSTILPNDDTRLARAGVTTVTGGFVCFRWILAHVLAFDHPYVAGPTSHDGIYVLDGVPPGDYTVACWHGPLTLTSPTGVEGRLEYVYGPSVQTTQTVTVEPGRRMRLDFVLDTPR